MNGGQIKKKDESAGKKLSARGLMALGKQWLVVYPIVFLVCLFGVGILNNGQGLSFVDLAAAAIPLGVSDLPDPTAEPLAATTLDLDGIELKLIYEKDTDRYLVYSRYTCVGYINRKDVDSAKGITSANIRELMQEVTK